MNHAVDVAFEANEQTEFGDVLDFAFNFGAGWVAVSEDFPWVALCLLQAKGYATFAGVDVQNHDFHFLRGGNDLARVDVLLSSRTSRKREPDLQHRLPAQRMRRSR